MNKLKTRSTIWRYLVNGVTYFHLAISARSTSLAGSKEVIEPSVSMLLTSHISALLLTTLITHTIDDVSVSSLQQIDKSKNIQNVTHKYPC